MKFKLKQVEDVFFKVFGNLRNVDDMWFKFAFELGNIEHNKLVDKAVREMYGKKKERHGQWRRSVATNNTLNLGD